jgi:hypothetical protein
MQPVQSVQPAKPVSAFRIGLLFGVVLGVILIALDFAGLFLQDIAILFNIMGIVIALVAYFFAGFRASSQSGKVSSGLLAGMWTGLISQILSRTVNVVTLALSSSRLHQLTDTENQALARAGSNVRVTDADILTFYIIIVVIIVIIVAAIALGVGAIGGAAGKGRAPISQQVYQESLYQSPMAGYPPQQPPYPGYPSQQPGGYYPQPGNYPPESGGYPPQS